MSNVTPAKEWRRTLEVKLPSGYTAEIRALDVGAFVRLGRIPDTITPIVEALVKGSENPLAADTLESIMRMAEFLNAVCMASFVNPKVVDREPDYERGEISVDDLTWDDKQMIMMFFNQPAQQLAKFRREQKDIVESVHDLQSSAGETVEVSGD